MERNRVRNIPMQPHEPVEAKPKAKPKAKKDTSESTDEEATD